MPTVDLGPCECCEGFCCHTPRQSSGNAYGLKRASGLIVMNDYSGLVSNVSPDFVLTNAGTVDGVCAWAEAELQFVVNQQGQNSGQVTVGLNTDNNSIEPPPQVSVGGSVLTINLFTISTVVWIESVDFAGSTATGGVGCLSAKFYPDSVCETPGLAVYPQPPNDLQPYAVSQVVSAADYQGALQINWRLQHRTRQNSNATYTIEEDVAGQISVSWPDMISVAQGCECNPLP